MTVQGKCFSLIRGNAMRVTALDGCGRLVSAGCSSVVSDGFVSVAYTAQTDTGDAINVKKANGKTCVNDTPAPTITGFGVEIAFCEVDPLLYTLLTGNPAIYDTDGVAVGFAVDGDVDVSLTGFALEVWSSVPGVACGASGGSYGYTLSPFLQGGVIGDFTIENGAVTFTVTGAQTKTGNAWGQGPYDVVPDETGTAGPLLEPIPTSRFLHVQWTSIAPPEPGCSCEANGVPATGATAGSPGTLTPADSYPPESFAALTADPLTASPTTAWTTGQYIVLGDGTHSYWDGTAWVAGEAP